MRYRNIVQGKFIRRPNRFVAEVEVGDTVQKVHVKNTGRLGEILKSGATVYLEDFIGRMGMRKMRYSMIAAEKMTAEGLMTVNIDSQAPNRVAFEALSEGRLIPPGLGKLTKIKPEKTYGDSRFDFYLEDEAGKRAFVEVKGVTLEHDGHASFPDAPTERGTRHIRELVKALNEGYNTYILFVIQMKPVKDMAANYEHDPDFSEALRKAYEAGVGVMVMDCIVTPDSLAIDKEVKVVF